MEQNGTKTKPLTAKQERAIQCLLSSGTLTEAAETAGVGKTTLFRWLNEPVFAAAYREERNRRFESACTILQAASADAAKTLQQIVNDPEVPVSVRVSSAKTILELSLRAKEQVDHEERLREIEAKLAAQTAPAVKRGL